MMTKQEVSQLCGRRIEDINKLIETIKQSNNAQKDLDLAIITLMTECELKPVEITDIRGMAFNERHISFYFNNSKKDNMWRTELNQKIIKYLTKYNETSFQDFVDIDYVLNLSKKYNLDISTEYFYLYSFYNYVKYKY